MLNFVYRIGADLVVWLQFQSPSDIGIWGESHLKICDVTQARPYQDLPDLVTAAGLADHFLGLVLSLILTLGVCRIYNKTKP